MMSPAERLAVLEAAKPNSWIALSADESRVVGQGDSYGEAVAEAKRNGEDDPLLIKIPDHWGVRVLGSCT